nr:hypothetical protein [Streptomyces harenosi]
MLAARVEQRDEGIDALVRGGVLAQDKAGGGPSAGEVTVVGGVAYGGQGPFDEQVAVVLRGALGGEEGELRREHVVAALPGAYGGAGGAAGRPRIVGVGRQHGVPVAADAVAAGLGQASVQEPARVARQPGHEFRADRGGGEPHAPVHPSDVEQSRRLGLGEEGLGCRAGEAAEQFEVGPVIECGERQQFLYLDR